MSFAAALVLNGLLLGGTYLVVWRWLQHRVRHRRIQEKQKVDWAQLKREWRNAFPTMLVGTLTSSVVIYLGSKGYTKIYTDFDSQPAFFGIFGFFILLLIDDAWFYWVHRLLHHPRLFRYVHLEHHKSVDVNPFTSLSFHFLEPVLLTIWIFPVALLLPTWAPVLGLVQVWGLLDNIKSHLGYEFYPAWWNRSPLRFLTSSTHHNLHHSKFKGNYGVHFRFWDRLMKTEFENYEDEFQKVKDKKPQHLTPGPSPAEL